MARDSFVFYRSFYDAVQQVPKKYRSEVYDAVFAYVFEAREITLSGVPGALWSLIKPQLDANNVRYENGKLGAEYGKKGGRPRKTKNDKNPDGVISKTPKGIMPKTPNVNVNENVNENVNVNVSGVPDEETTDNDTPSETETTGRPSNLDILGEIVSKNYKLDGPSIKAFVDYNEERNWKMDWRLALKRWADREKNQTDQPKKNPAGKFANFPQRSDPVHKALVDEVIKQQTGG